MVRRAAVRDDKSAADVERDAVRDAAVQIESAAVDDGIVRGAAGEDRHAAVFVESRIARGASGGDIEISEGVDRGAVRGAAGADMQIAVLVDRGSVCDAIAHHIQGLPADQIPLVHGRGALNQLAVGAVIDPGIRTGKGRMRSVLDRDGTDARSPFDLRRRAAAEDLESSGVDHDLVCGCAGVDVQKTIVRERGVVRCAARVDVDIAMLGDRVVRGAAVVNAHGFVVEDHPVQDGLGFVRDFIIGHISFSVQNERLWNIRG